MTFDQSFVNWDEGFSACLWNAKSEEDLEALFTKAGTPYERIIAVEERIDKTLMPDPP